MAFQTGTSTDYQDLLADLRTFCLANGWTSDRYTTGAEDEVIFHGDGGASDEIYVGIKTYSNPGPGYYNWELRGFTGFDNGLAFESQPGLCPATYVPLRNLSMDYWFFVDGRRICATIKTGSSYQFVYAGFIDPYSTDAEWPYPLLIMGSSGNSTTVFNSNEISYSSSINPALGRRSGRHNPCRCGQLIRQRRLPGRPRRRQPPAGQSASRVRAAVVMHVEKGRTAV